MSWTDWAATILTGGTYAPAIGNTGTQAQATGEAKADEVQVTAEIARPFFEELTAAGIPEKAASGYAQQIGDKAREVYAAELAAGKSPADARAAAAAAVVPLQAQIRAANKVPAPGDATDGQVSAAGDGTGPGATVGDADVKGAWEQYQGGIKEGKGNLQGIIDNPINDPNARNVGRKIIGYEKKLQAGPEWDYQNDQPLERMVDDLTKPIYGEFEGIQERNVTATGYEPTLLAPAARLEAAKQAGVTVGGADTTDLAETAAGRGAGQLSAAARYDQLLRQTGQSLNAASNAARGSERKGARLASALRLGEERLAGGAKIEEINAEARAGAQGKIADLQQQKSNLQAELDSARNAGDANRIQDITKKMADIDLEIGKSNSGLLSDAAKFKAGAENDVATGNANRSTDVQGKNLELEGRGVVAGGEQDIAQADLRIRAQKAIEQSAGGLLNEAGRQEAIRMARAQLALSEKQLALSAKIADANARAQAQQKASQDRAFWTTTLTTLLAGAATAIGGPVAGAAVGAGAGALAPKPNPYARGGAVTKPTEALVGEAGHHEIMIPLRGKLSERMAAALAGEMKPFDAGAADGPDEIKSPGDLTAAIKATLATFRAKAGKRKNDEAEDEVTGMASAALRSRKNREARS